MLKKIINYFDLLYEPERPTVQAAVKKTYVYLQYISFVLGILAQPFLDEYALNGQASINFPGLLQRALFSVIMGLVLFPLAYKAAWDKRSAFFVQFCTIFSAGIGWQSLFSAGHHVLN